MATGTDPSVLSYLVENTAKGTRKTAALLDAGNTSSRRLGRNCPNAGDLLKGQAERNDKTGNN
jgi:hypothetical protein